MAEVRLIDANALDALEDLKYIYRPVCDGDAWYRAEDVWKCIGEQPTIDPESLRPKGRWIETDWVEPDGHYFECVHTPKAGLLCSECRHCFKKDLLWKDNFCPNCGAQMTGGG